MKFRVEYTERAVKTLRKLDRGARTLILAWIEKNLVGCTDPRRHGKALAGDRGGQWRYHVGDYRIIARISDETITILILDVGHRSTVYKKT